MISATVLGAQQDSLAIVSPVSMNNDSATVKDSSLLLSKEQEPAFFSYVRTCISKGLAVIEQPYSPIDSFGVTWQFGKVRPSLPRELGWLVDGELIVSRALLTPWENDPEFIHKGEDFQWEAGILEDSCRYRWLHGDSLWQQTVIDSSNASLLKLASNREDQGFEVYPEIFSGANEVAMWVLVSSVDSVPGTYKIDLWQANSTISFNKTISSKGDAIIGGGRLIVSSSSGKIDLKLESILAFYENLWQNFFLTKILIE